MKSQLLKTEPLRSREERDQLIEQYQSYAQSVVNKLSFKMRLPAQMKDDVLAAGYLGLIDAAEKFDESVPGSFKGYAYIRIRGSMIDYLRKMGLFRGENYYLAKALIAGDSLKTQYLSKYSPFIDGLVETPKATKRHRASLLGENVLDQDSQRSNSDGEISLKIDRSRLEGILNFASKALTVFDLARGSIETKSDQFDVDENQESLLLLKERDENLYKKISELTDEQRLVIEGYYLKDLTFEEIAKKCNNPKSWAWRVHEKAITALQAKFRMESIVHSTAYPKKSKTNISTSDAAPFQKSTKKQSEKGNEKIDKSPRKSAKAPSPPSPARKTRLNAVVKKDSPEKKTPRKKSSKKEAPKKDSSKKKKT